MTDKLRQAEQEPVAERFEKMHANGDVWITTLAAAAIARNTATQQAEQEPLMITPGGGAFPFAVVGEIEQVEQEPVAWESFDRAYEKACKSSNPQDWMEAALLAQQIRTASVRTKDLTDEELWEAAKTAKSNDLTDAFRAVIEKFKEKNNANNNS